MLFRPGEIFELRVKDAEQRGTKQYWLAYDQAETFLNVHIPIHTEKGRHIWIGVSPRPRAGDTSPTLHRALWCDFSEGITSEAQVNDAIALAKLPRPTMLVNSGNGYHAYWELDKPLSAVDARPYAKGIHEALPTDTTYDSTRVMRVPGTINPKNGNNTLCHIVYHEKRTVAPTEFPRVDDAADPLLAPSRPATQLTSDDFDLFVTAWLPGQKHNVAVGVAGYLRKNLHYTQEQCLAEIRRIHEQAGYSWVEDKGNLTDVVEDTYKRLAHQVSGVARLEEYGIVPRVKETFRATFRVPPKPKMRLIDFSKDIPPTEFWVDGLVGPGLLTMWAASPKTGKSMSIMQVGHALATGVPIWDFQTDGKPHSVLYFQGELSQSMVAQRARDMFGLGALKPRQFAITDKPDETISLLQNPEVLIDMAEDFEVVIIDPISVFNSNDENSWTSVRETLGVFDRLKAANKAVILVHHTNKLATNAEGNEIEPSFSNVRGSGGWFAAMDALALQYRLGEGNTRVKFMFRAAPERPPLTLYRQDHGGFTSNRAEYLRTKETLRVPIASELN